MAQKLSDIVNLLEFDENQIVIVTETRERPNIKASIAKFEEMNSLTWHSRPRETGEGGGVGIAVSNDFGKSSTLSLPNPLGFEVVWCLITPAECASVKIIVASFYSPPQSSKYANTKGELQDYILETMGLCTQKYGEVFYVLGGDINTDEIGSLVSLQGFNQVVDVPTRGRNILDVLITNLEAELVRIQPPLAPDSPSNGAPSDHKIPIVYCHYPPKPRKWMKFQRRLFLRSKVDNYAQELQSIQWRNLLPGKSVDQQVAIFQTELETLADKAFPLSNNSCKGW